MNESLSDHHRTLLRATVPAMIRPFERKGGGYPKRLYRQLKAEYMATHNILGEIELLARRTPGCASQRFTPELLIRAVRNYERAEQLLNQARRLPRTSLCARIRSLAMDNESVALEVLEAVANIANRAPVVR